MKKQTKMNKILSYSFWFRCNHTLVSINGQHGQRRANGKVFLSHKTVIKPFFCKAITRNCISLQKSKIEFIII